MKTIDYEMLMNSVAEFGKEKNPNFRLSDDDKNIYSMVLMYFNEDPRFEQISPSYTLKKGLLIRGNVGVGKTMMMKMVLDFSLARYKYRPFKIIPCHSLSTEFIKNGAETITKNTTNSFNYYSKKPVTICYDDLGAETLFSSHYSNKLNVMQMILMGRYEQFIEVGMKTFITTNLLREEMDELYGYRIRSRLREMCNDIHYPGKDRRK